MFRKPSHSRSISTIPKHQNNIKLMPKLLLKTLKSMKRHRRQRSITFPGAMNVNLNDGGDRRSKVVDDHSKISTEEIKHSRKKNQLMQLLPHSKSIRKVVSTLFRNKSRDHESDTTDHNKSVSNKNLAKQGSKGSSRCSPTAFSTALSDSDNDSVIERAEERDSCSEFSPRDCKEEAGNAGRMSFKGFRLRRAKSASRVGDGSEVKVGFRIKVLTKIKSRGRGEKRYELCKKKILMGEKCRPLNGSLRYDKHGVLVPEDLS